MYVAKYIANRFILSILHAVVYLGVFSRVHFGVAVQMVVVFAFSMVTLNIMVVIPVAMPMVHYLDRNTYSVTF